MDEIKYQMEIAAFSEKIALAKLEVSKAQERVQELEYEQARYQTEWLHYLAKSMAKNPQKA